MPDRNGRVRAGRLPGATGNRHITSSPEPGGIRPGTGVDHFPYPAENPPAAADHDCSLALYGVVMLTWAMVTRPLS